MVLTSANTFELPSVRSHKAPLYEEGQWFAQEHVSLSLPEGRRIRDLERDCEKALIVAGIQEHECPTPNEWAYVCIAGALVAALTDKYPTIPEQYHGDAELVMWEVLWKAVEENREKLEGEFLAVMMRILLPRHHYSPPGHPWRESNFAQWWGNIDLGYPDNPHHSIANLRLKRLREGREAFTRLSGPVQASVREVAQHVPAMLEIVNGHIRRRYLW